MIKSSWFLVLSSIQDLIIYLSRLENNNNQSYNKIDKKLQKSEKIQNNDKKYKISKILSKNYYAVIMLWKSLSFIFAYTDNIITIIDFHTKVIN